MHTRWILVVLAALTAVLPPLRAAEPKAETPASKSEASVRPEALPANPDPSLAIRKTIEARFAGTKVVDVQPSPLPGLYEVFLGDRIVYSDATADHLLVGNLVDTRSRTDLTAAKMEQRDSIDYPSLPFDKAIKIVRGKGSRQLAVFEDPDCPFCRKLEQELATIPDITVYVFLFPIDSLHPQATLHSHQIWCASDRGQAWAQWLLERKALPTAVNCKGDPVAELTKLGEKLYVNGTPTLFFPSGKRVGGAIPTAELQQRLAAETGSPRAAGALTPDSAKAAQGH